ncbi:anti-sigma F factor [Syntrophomonas palmitatica]|uniref:anti-sigma F factor n=1 Tax=Syntrophomonas palmitatica TaxID=402877 RepID=UPI0006D2A2E8|nr:anti-sigma F factor [Syntrophomonas palmitatica]
MNIKNYIRFEFPSLPENAALARTCVSSFAAQLNCTLEDIEEIKLVVSEAVSNCIIHGYENRSDGKIVIECSIDDNRSLEINIIDYGKGIDNLEQAMQPAYSSVPSRMGLGFTFMKSFMDEMGVTSSPHEGTSVRLKRSFLKREQEAYA